MAYVWGLQEGISTVRAVYSAVYGQYGYHITIGGELLAEGEADRLSLYCLPITNTFTNVLPDALLAWLEDLWGKSQSLTSRTPVAPHPVARRQEPEPADFILQAVPLDMAELAQTTYQLKSTNYPANSGAISYKHSRKFVRPDGGRIDCYIF